MGETSQIPFNKPTVVGNEVEYIRSAVAHGHTASSGPFTEEARSILRDELGCRDVFLTTSCTAALEMTALLLDPQPGDTVIVPSFTFVTTALAFARAGFGLVFADIEPETQSLDPTHVAELIDDTTRAVIAVHYAGVSAALDDLLAVLSQHPSIHLIEDNAHGLFATHRGQRMGTFGRFSTLSFHETKNIICGEGGALVVNEADDVDRARVVLDKGTDRQRFLDGAIDKYSWRDTGSSFGLSDINAAFLLAQLENRDEIMSRRRAVWDTYHSQLEPHAADLGVRLPTIPADATSGYHMYHVILPNAEMRPRVIETMKSQGVQPTFHYVPLHSSDGGRRFSARTTECPVTDDISSRLLRLPFFTSQTTDEVERSAESLLAAVASA